MNALLKGLRFALVSAFTLAYIGMAHVSAHTADGGPLPVVVGLMPVVAGALVLAWQARWRWSALALCLIGVALLWREQDWLARNIVWVYFLQGIGTDLLLATVFGRTLTTPDNSLCTRMARAVRGGNLPQANIRYTYQVTAAWTIYFLLSASVSSTLFLSGHRVLWSWFANLLYLPLLGIMFVGEHLVRTRVIPAENRVGFLQTFRAIRAVGKSESGQQS